MAYEQTAFVLRLDEGRRRLSSKELLLFHYGFERAGSTRDPNRLEPNVHGKLSLLMPENYYRHYYGANCLPRHDYCHAPHQGVY